MTDKNKRSKKADTVENIQLSKKNLKLRMILFVLLLALGFTAFGYALFSALSTESGWREIEANATAEINCSSEFVFLYNVGASGISATTENKAITSLYTDAAVHAYQMFTNDQGYDDVNNVYYINQHPNEEIAVDAALYEAFELIQEYENRLIFLAAVYMQYDDMFYLGDDLETVDCDPYVNEEVAKQYAEISAFARDKESVDIQLLGDNKVKLFVSDEYLKYAEENYITSFIDFFWMKNAFIVDYLAEVMIDKGYTLGSISSYDGFSRNLDESDTSYSFNIYDRLDNTIYPATVMQYSGAYSIVYMRDYVMNEMDAWHYRQMQNGEVRTSYLDIEDGKCKSAIDSLVSYSEEMGCAEVLLNIAPFYITETFEENEIQNLKESGIYSVYCIDTVIHYNDSDVKMTDVFENEDVKYSLDQI